MRSSPDVEVPAQIDELADELATRGDVHEPGSWGRLMNGGAWLDLDGLRVDVLLRDVAVVEHWTGEARRGRYEVDGLLGYVAGIPTYSLTAEAAIAQPLRGTLDLVTSFPEQLAAAAPARWRFSRDLSFRAVPEEAPRPAVRAASLGAQREATAGRLRAHRGGDAAAVTGGAGLSGAAVHRYCPESCR